jgi:alpha-mannosidase
MADSSFAGLLYPKSELDRLWKLVLLNQFHDVLPGSSIGCVYEDSALHYKDILGSGKALEQKALEYIFRQLLGKSITRFDEKSIEELLTNCPMPMLINPQFSKVLTEPFSLFVVNTLSTRRKEVAEIALGAKIPENFCFSTQISSSGDKVLAMVEIDGLSATMVPINKFDINSSAKGYTAEGGTFILENSLIRASFDQHGRLISLFDKEELRDCILPGHLANRFKLYEDIPLFWDAWDVGTVL